MNMHRSPSGRLRPVRTLPRALYHRPWWRPALQAAFNLSSLAALGAAVLVVPWWSLRTVLWVLMGVVLAGFLNAAHDCLHSTQAASKPANRALGLLWCLPLLVNYTNYKYAHLVHHRFTRRPGDSESVMQFGGVADYLRQMLLHNPLRPLLGSWNAIRDVHPAWVDTPDKRWAAKVDALAVLAWASATLVLTVAFPRPMLLLYWLPVCCYGPMVLFFSLPEHYGCESSAEIHRSTRSVRSNALIRAWLWNGGFHAEHHAHPGVPSLRLGELHRDLGYDKIGWPTSYLRFHASIVRVLWQVSNSPGISHPPA